MTADPARLPAWLADLGSRALACARPAAKDSDIQPGDVRVVAPMDGPGRGVRRLVLVLACDWDAGVADVALLSADTDLPGARDVLLDGDDDLPYRLLVEMDVLGPVFFVQLDERVGRVDRVLVERLGRGPFTDFAHVPPATRGLPVVSRSDPRWGFKETELREFGKISRDARIEQVGQPTTVIDPVVWARVLDPDEDLSDADAARLANRALSAPAPADPHPLVLVGVKDHLRGASARFADADDRRRVLVHLQRGLRTATSPLHVPVPQGRAVDDSLGVVLRDAAARGERAISVRSSRVAWIDPPRHQRLAGPFGDVQLTIELLD